MKFFSIKYPGVKRHPYFINNIQWTKDVSLRLSQVSNVIARTPPTIVKVRPNYPVKGETTGTRLGNYLMMRGSSHEPYINIEWVEWRKDSVQQTVGRPATLIKTEPVLPEILTDGFATNVFAHFSNGNGKKLWLTCAKSLSRRTSKWR